MVFASTFPKHLLDARILSTFTTFRVLSALLRLRLHTNSSDSFQRSGSTRFSQLQPWVSSGEGPEEISSTLAQSTYLSTVFKHLSNSTYISSALLPVSPDTFQTSRCHLDFADQAASQLNIAIIKLTRQTPKVIQPARFFGPATFRTCLGPYLEAVREIRRDDDFFRVGEMSWQGRMVGWYLLFAEGHTRLHVP